MDDNEINYALPFADLVQRDGPLKRAFEAGNIPIAGFGMFLTDATVDPFAPEVETAALEFPPHECDHARLGETKLQAYGLEWRPVLPGHLNDAVYVFLLHGAKVSITRLRKY